MTSCPAGTVISVQPTTTSDRQCEACGSGSFQPTSDHADTSCSKWSDCDAGTYIEAEGTATTNRQCSPCSSMTYQDQANQASCKDVPSGSYRVSASDIEACPAGYRCVDGQQHRCVLGQTYQSKTGQSECLDISRCGPGKRMTKAPTLVSDTVCDACVSGTYNAELSSLNSTCLPLSTCPPVCIVVSCNSPLTFLLVL